MEYCIVNGIMIMKTNKDEYSLHLKNSELGKEIPIVKYKETNNGREYLSYNKKAMDKVNFSSSENITTSKIVAYDCYENRGNLVFEFDDNKIKIDLDKPSELYAKNLDVDNITKKIDVIKNIAYFQINPNLFPEKFNIFELLEQNPKIGLCEGRHEIPGVSDYIFSEIQDVTNFNKMQAIAFDKLKELKTDFVDIYVTGLTAALISTLNAANELNMQVNLYHYDRDKDDYVKQEVSNLANPNVSHERKIIMETKLKDDDYWTI